MLSLSISALARLTNETKFIGKDVVETDSLRTLSGEVSVLRYLAKSNSSVYGNGDVFAQCENDLWLDWAVSSLISLSTINEALKDRTFLAGSQLGLADVLAWSFITLNSSNVSDEFPNIKRWLKTLEYSAALKEAKKEYQQQQAAAAKKKPASGNTNAPSAGGKKYGNCPILEGNPDPKNVVTRFPPEPSGHLHIGHCKALFLNQYYARDYQGPNSGGKLILRFDDTNPAAEKGEYEDAILADLATLEVIPDIVTHTSDYFDEIIKKAEELINKGLAYCDYSTQPELAIQRGGTTGVRLPSPCRDQPKELNLEMFKAMKEGKEFEVQIGDKKEKRMCSLRARVTDSKGTPGYLCGNGSMRDPVLFRVILDPPHAKKGRKYKMYPTYDFACPIVDSIEGVTHVLRDSQYSDRTEQFDWIQAALGLRRCYIQQFSRVNFKQTLMSKRKLAALIQEGYAGGWDDPRFPTVKGMNRRGLLVESIRSFMLELGGSLKQVELEWDKIWSDNMRRLDAIAKRYMAVDSESNARIEIINFNEYHSVTQPGNEIVTISAILHPKDASKGNKSVLVNSKLRVEQIDLKDLKVGEILGLMRYCVTKVEEIVNDNLIRVSIVPDGDFRKCNRLITWVADSPHEPKVIALEYGHILKPGKDDDEDEGGDVTSNDDWRKNINEVSKASTLLVANSAILLLQKGEFIQIERRGFFKVDKPYSPQNGELMELILVPDGKTKTMSTIQGKLEHH